MVAPVITHKDYCIYDIQQLQSCIKQSTASTDERAAEAADAIQATTIAEPASNYLPNQAAQASGVAPECDAAPAAAAAAAELPSGDVCGVGEGAEHNSTVEGPGTSGRHSYTVDDLVNMLEVCTAWLLYPAPVAM